VESEWNTRRQLDDRVLAQARRVEDDQIAGVMAGPRRVLVVHGPNTPPSVGIVTVITLLGWIPLPQVQSAATACAQLWIPQLVEVVLADGFEVAAMRDTGRAVKSSGNKLPGRAVERYDKLSESGSRSV
jgi:hypothetical protein